MANVLDNLSGSSALISVRGRASFSRPFERVEALRHQADDRLPVVRPLPAVLGFDHLDAEVA